MNVYTTNKWIDKHKLADRSCDKTRHGLGYYTYSYLLRLKVVLHFWLQVRKAKCSDASSMSHRANCTYNTEEKPVCLDAARCE